MRRFIAIIGLLAGFPGMAPSATAVPPQIVMPPMLGGPARVDHPPEAWRAPQAALSDVGPLRAPGVDPIGLLIKRLGLTTRPGARSQSFSSEKER